ncbi:MAG: NADP-dependent oxidoreductase [Bacteroidia bacterium]
MKGLFLTGYGFRIRRKLKFLEKEIADPGPDDVLIEICAAGLNPVDFKFIYGMALIIIQPKLPYVLGFDLAGKIIAKGEQVTGFQVGDEVYSKVPWDQMGTITEKIVVRENMIALKPRNLTFEEAAGIPLVGCTVWDSFNVGEVKKGTRLLIIGASGGIGTIAIQYAKYLGAYVIALTSTKNVEFVRSLGADEVIDYKKEDFRKVVKEIDVVFDTVGGKYPRQSLRVVKKGEKIISIAGHHDNETLKQVGIAWIFRLAFLVKGSILMWRMRQKNVFYKHVWSSPNQEKLKKIASLIEAGHIQAITDRVYDFKDAIDGLEYLQTGRARKVVVQIKK